MKLSKIERMRAIAYCTPSATRMSKDICLLLYMKRKLMKLAFTSFLCTEKLTFFEVMFYFSPITQDVLYKVMKPQYVK